MAALSSHICKRHGKVEAYVTSRKGTKSGRRIRCKKCEAEWAKGYFAKNKKRQLDRIRKWSLNKKYGMTEAEYEGLLSSQGGLCAICGLPPGKKRLSVDHDHRNNRVRGLAHAHCNLGLGSFRDDPRLLILAARYLILNRRSEDARKIEVQDDSLPF